MLRDLTLRRLAPEDEDALAALFAANDVPAVTRWFDPFALTASTARELSGHRGRDLYWGVWEAPDLVGLAMVRGWDGGYPHPAYGYFIDVARQGQGRGGAATVLALEELGRLSVPEVRARVHADNAASLSVLRSAGFVEVGREDGRVLLSARPAGPR